MHPTSIPSDRARSLAVFPGGSNGEFNLPPEQALVIERGEDCWLWDTDGVHHFTRIDVDDDELWVTATDQDGQQVDRFLVNKFVDVSIKDDEFLHIPETFAWTGPYPNPVRDTTTVVYRIARGTQVRLELFDVLGRKISTLVDRHHFPDSYVVTLDATALAAGTYVLQLTAGAVSRSRQITVVR